MPLPTDLREFIESLNSNSVEYLVVGAFALAFHGHPRYTGDLDVLVRASPQNAGRLEKVLREFGFAALGLSAADFLGDNAVVQLGHPPSRIDLLTSLTGVSFEDAWSGRTAGELDGIPVWFIGRESFIRNKKATNRARDRADLEALGEE